MPGGTQNHPGIFFCWRRALKELSLMHGRTLTAFAAALAALVLLAVPATAQQSSMPSAELEALQQDIQQLKAGQAEVLRRLEALQKAVEAGGSGRRREAPFRGAEISITDAPSKGSVDAKLVLIEFSDYQCPFCRRFSNSTLPQILKDYVDTGKMRYVFRDFPLPSIHPAATEAAVAARCAGQQGKYWEMHDRFFADPKSVQAKNWKDHAEALDLDGADFDVCMADESHERAVRQSAADGGKIGVSGTPTLFLGTLGPDGETVKATEIIRGAQPYGNFKQLIDGLLAKAG
jgi:protein-disulfide isomerase